MTDNSFDRLPPHDIEAEQCALGSAMLSPNAASILVEELREDDFFRPAHQTIHAAIATLLENNEQVNAVTVRTELERRRLEMEQGNANRENLPDGVYLHSLIADVPIVGSVGFYVKRLRSLRNLRALVYAGPRIAQIGWNNAAEDVDHALEMANKVLDEATHVATKSTAASVADLITPFLERLESGEKRSGLSTGWVDVDSLLSGMRPGQLITIGARPGMGKALALDTPIPTPTGWTTMKDIQVGDYVLGMDGKPTRVTLATDVMYDHDCYDVEFSDGTVITADAEHLWLTETRASRRAATAPGGYVHRRESLLSRDQRWKNEKPSIKTTEQIRATLRTGSDDRLNHSVPVAAPLELPDVELPIDPYILGYWLGDGATAGGRISVGDDDLLHLLEQIEAAGYHHKARRDVTAWDVLVSTHPQFAWRRGLTSQLRSLGVQGNKHIPQIYLRASEAQRRALLAGLLDSDGTVNPGGRVSFEVTSRRLAEDARELVATLGYQPHMYTKPVKGRAEASSTCYRVGFMAAGSVFRLPRKAARAAQQVRTVNGRRYIADVRPTDSVPVRCIGVDNADHMYLSSKAYIPTHNTAAMANLAHHVGVKLGLPVFVATLEMSTDEFMGRIVAHDAKVELKRLLEPELLTEDDWDRLGRSHSRLAEAGTLVIDDEPGMGIGHIRGALRSMRRSGRPAALAVIDYLQLMQSTGRSENRQVEVSQISRSLKLLAKEFEVPIVIGAQLNREVERRADKRPNMADLRESGSVEQDSDVVVLLYRDDAYDPESPRSGELDFIVDKNRSGPRGTITLAFQGHYSRVADMAKTEWSPTGGLA